MSGVYVQTGPTHAGLLLKAWVQGELGVRPARRIYRLVSIVTTYPNGIENPVLVYNWVTEGGDMEQPWHTPAVPDLHAYSASGSNPLSFHETRVVLTTYQADGDDRKEWSRIIEYADVDTNAPLLESSLGKLTQEEIISWPDSGTRVKARACFQSNAGRGPWSAFSNPVTTTEPAP
jgi:hypothetical protein